ncbi:PstS family phosphate ABC transporter substrate-binding protein [Pleionea sediminis]|uniref:PstS family phosphate ABC transporter substrate-binding protein n=1 Tax=Pleionea sediminis TaxID=2569479 RepID=UPI001184836B|nr:phosphate ABC transporter substrate-binding protein PstS family protein [Pleionea sediminis]
MKLLKNIALAASMAATVVVSAAGAKVDPNLSDYEKTSGISGNLSSVGSDTLANLMTLWQEEFKRIYPNVNIQIQAAGSSTAPPALTQGTSNFGPMSRKMKSKEIAAFEKKHGYKPTAIPVAIDALAVYVNKDNPIKGLTIPQVDAIFSSTRKCKAEGDIASWEQVGVDGLGVIQLFGRNSVSGTYGYFKKKGLCKGDFKNSVNEQPGSAAVVQAISQSKNGIGYSGIGYITSGVRLVPLAKKEGQPFVEATPENALNGSFPLSRYLYVYVNKHPNKPLSPLEREFLKLVVSKKGQEVVVKDGYVPLPAKVAEKVLKMIE